jgi:hypothetical protein
MLATLSRIMEIAETTTALLPSSLFFSYFTHSAVPARCPNSTKKGDFTDIPYLKSGCDLMVST